MVAHVLPFKVKGAVVHKRRKRVLGPVDLDILSRGTTAVIGPNGSGKTTLLRLIHGLEKLHEGTVDWNCDPELAYASQSFVFQSPIMLRRTALENVVYPLKLRGKPKTECKIQGEHWLDKVGLASASKLDAANLSGGEKQKLALARALISEPQLLILDEPTSNLDGKATREIEHILQGAASSGVKMILATHDMGQAKRLADEILFLHRGFLHERRDSSSFFAKPKTAEAQAFLQGEIVE